MQSPWISCLHRLYSRTSFLWRSWLKWQTKNPKDEQQLDQFPGAHLQNRTLLFIYRRRRRIVLCLPRVWNKRPCLDNAGLNSYKGNRAFLVLSFNVALRRSPTTPFVVHPSNRTARTREKENQKGKGDRDSSVATKSEMITHKRWLRKEGEVCRRKWSWKSFSRWIRQFCRGLPCFSRVFFLRIHTLSCKLHDPRFPGARLFRSFSTIAANCLCFVKRDVLLRLVYSISFFKYRLFVSSSNFDFNVRMSTRRIINFLFVRIGGIWLSFDWKPVLFFRA